MNTAAAIVARLPSPEQKKPYAASPMLPVLLASDWFWEDMLNSGDCSVNFEKLSMVFPESPLSLQASGNGFLFAVGRIPPLDATIFEAVKRRP
jgi:hypothetical protein